MVLLRSAHVRQIVLVASLTSLVGCAYHDDGSGLSPSPVPTPAAPPASIALSAVNGVGSAAGRVYVTARVSDAAGAALKDIAITFATTSGDVAPTVVPSDAFGQAVATVTVSGQADVSARTGGVATAMTVTPIAVFQPVPPTPPTPGPVVPIPPTPPPSQPPPQEALHVDLSVSPLQARVGMMLNFTALGSAAITGASWDFGDGSTAQTSSGQASHAYTSIGTFQVAVTAQDAASRSTTARLSVTVQQALSALVSCVTSIGSLTASCNMTLFLSGAGTASPAIVTWDWADGSAPENAAPARAHTFPVAGTYFIGVTATQDGQSATARASVVVPKAP